MPLVYIEYRRRHDGVTPDEYAAWFGRDTGRVSGETETDDRLLYNLARTWRLGDGPPYLMIYHTERFGLERLDAWQETWTSGDERIEAISARSAGLGWVERAGCYRPLRAPVPGHPGPYYLEAFTRTAADDAAVVDELEAGEGDLPLLLALDRLGHLGPDPGGIALWGLPDFAALETFVGAGRTTVAVTGAAVYAALGSEVA